MEGTLTPVEEKGLAVDRLINAALARALELGNDIAVITFANAINFSVFAGGKWVNVAEHVRDVRNNNDPAPDIILSLYVRANLVPEYYEGIKRATWDFTNAGAVFCLESVFIPIDAPHLPSIYLRVAGRKNL